MDFPEGRWRSWPCSFIFQKESILQNPQCLTSHIHTNFLSAINWGNLLVMTQKFLHTSRQEEDFPCAVWHSSWVWLQKRSTSEHFTQVREKWCFEQMRFLQTSHGPLSQGIIRNYAQIQWSGEIFLLWVCVLSATTLLYHLTRDYFKGLSSAMDLTSQTWQECNILQRVLFIFAK